MKPINEKVLHHWADNLINAIKYCRTSYITYLYRIRVSSSFCEWCKIFGVDVRDMCFLCPIYLETGERHCSKTPWTTVEFNLLQCREESHLNIGKHKASLVEAVWKEYLFIKQCIERNERWEI